MKELKTYLVTMGVNNTDGNLDTGMMEPDWFMELIAARDEEEAEYLAKIAYSAEDFVCTNVREVTVEEIEEINKYEEAFAEFREEEN